ncbi:ribosome-binding factor A [Mycoplasma ovis str. Michigan]|uniref:Ribosome-binding factor A n=1 Tax=Mycoplasma ovis str. Michigan TaxID=1415773 RepID=A0ABM5P0D9_9MOLU|nr:30S ribosome-binding factor RbfA [Mycoplasma ovis]AHC39872.1 ribosome-binding factor A [Mycoplasma ovis str. Michigan]
MSIINERLSKDIYVVLKRIWLTELDEQIYSFIGINHIKLSRNLTNITIFIDLELLKQKYQNKDIFYKLEKLTPFFKRQLVHKLNLPPHLKLSFREDLFIQKARKVEELINSSLTSS